LCELPGEDSQNGCGTTRGATCSPVDVLLYFEGDDWWEDIYRMLILFFCNILTFPLI